MLHLHDSAQRAQREFVPIDPENIRVYVCGPTVYDLAHLGNARSAVVFDQLRRVLMASYPRVSYVRNITDIDDKIIARAAELGESIGELTARTHRAYLEDTAALGVLAPTVEPRATEHVGAMQTMIATLIERGNAYESMGHVLFSVATNPHAGQLTGHHHHDGLLEGASGRVEPAPYKRDGADFVLWKPSLPSQPGWDSPWGRGRPGWHIECSAMAAQHLGPVFDIHGGGHDLVFPHHEAEIAQSTAAHGTHEMARYWVHNGMLSVDGAKMSKSAGNFLTVRQLLEEYPGRGEALRLVLLSAHYRQSLDWTRARVLEAVATLDRFQGALRGLDLRGSGVVDPDVWAALEDDLNTPLALAHLHALASRVLAAHGTQKLELALGLKASANMLGLLEADPETWFQGDAGDDVTRIEVLMTARAGARASRDFALSDQLRGQLLELGVVVEDSRSGSTWRRA